MIARYLGFVGLDDRFSLFAKPRQLSTFAWEIHFLSHVRGHAERKVLKFPLNEELGYAALIRHDRRFKILEFLFGEFCGELSNTSTGNVESIKTLFQEISESQGRIFFVLPERSYLVCRQGNIVLKHADNFVQLGHRPFRPEVHPRSRISTVLEYDFKSRKVTILPDSPLYGKG